MRVKCTLFPLAAAAALGTAGQAPRIDHPTGPSSLADRGAALNVSVSAAAGKREYRPLEPVVVEIEVENVSAVLMRTPSATSAYARTVLEVYRTGRGRSLATAYGDSERGKSLLHGGKLLALMPGARFRETLVANLAFDMTMPGSYEIVVGVPVVDMEARESSVAHSRILHVTVAGEPVDGAHPKRLEPPRRGTP